MITELNERSKEIFRQIVDAYVSSGEPVGSRTIARRLETTLSPATIRNVMADLEEAGLLMAPHTSAGRMPTEAGLRLYVDGLLEVGDLSDEERGNIESHCAGVGRSVAALLSEASDALSGLARSAGLVVAPTSERAFKHIEFVPLSPGRALVVMVADNGMVENRVIEVPVGMPASALVEAGNYLTTRVTGRTLSEAAVAVMAEIEAEKAALDAATRKVVSAGLATWASDRSEDGDKGVLIVRGHAHLLDDVTNLAELERIRTLFEALETKENLLRLLELTRDSSGVQVFIGAENQLFGLSGCSTIVAPYFGSDGDQDSKKRVVGAIGVIGPTRMNYARIVPMVDYTARVVSRLLGSPESELKA